MVSMRQQPYHDEKCQQQGNHVTTGCSWPHWPQNIIIHRYSRRVAPTYSSNKNKLKVITKQDIQMPEILDLAQAEKMWWG